MHRCAVNGWSAAIDCSISLPYNRPLNTNLQLQHLLAGVFNRTTLAWPLSSKHSNLPGKPHGSHLDLSDAPDKSPDHVPITQLPYDHRNIPGTMSPPNYLQILINQG